jgi:hypothetical protein
MQRKYFFIVLVSLFALSFSIFQYTKEFQADYIKAAYDAVKKANGHTWDEMECTSDLCVKTGIGVGIGTSSPSQKLDVVGTIKGTDVCNSAICLSQIATYYAANPLYGSTHTIANCGTAGGTVVANPDGSGLPICQFANTAGTSCPTAATSNGTGAWTMYKNWTETVVATHRVGCFGCGWVSGCISQNDFWTARTESHRWNNTAVESTSYNTYDLDEWGVNYNCNNHTFYATITKIGCY